MCIRNLLHASLLGFALCYAVCCWYTIVYNERDWWYGLTSEFFYSSFLFKHCVYVWVISTWVNTMEVWLQIKLHPCDIGKVNLPCLSFLLCKLGCLIYSSYRYFGVPIVCSALRLSWWTSQSPWLYATFSLSGEVVHKYRNKTIICNFRK